MTKTWSDGAVIAEYTLIPVLFGLFVAWEAYMGERAMLPAVMFKRRLISAAAIIAIFQQGFFTFLVYYLSDGYQALYDTSATSSGIELLPMIAVGVLS